MAYIDLPESSDDPTVQAVLDQTSTRWGFQPNIIRALAIRPDIMAAEETWCNAIVYNGQLPRELKETIATTVSVVNNCNYCATSHAMKAAEFGAPPGTDAACRNLVFTDYPASWQAALAYTKKLASNMNQVTQADIDQLRVHFTAQEIVEIAAVVASFMMYNTFVTGLGLELEEIHGHGLLADPS